MLSVSARTFLLTCAWVEVAIAARTNLAAAIAQAACPPLTLNNPHFPICGGQPRPQDDGVGHCYDTEARYCEVFVPTEGGLLVWNSFGCGECPGAAFNSLQGVIKAGPFYLMADTMTLEPVRSGASVDANGAWIVQNFGQPSMAFRLLAFKPTTQGGGPYKESNVNRDNTMKWGAGRQLYQLTDDNTGSVYTLFMPRGTNDNTSFGSLFDQDFAALGSTLGLPDGWTYACKVLGTGGFELQTLNGVAKIVQDDNGNVYQLTPTPTCNRFVSQPCITETSAARQERCDHQLAQLPGASSLEVASAAQ